MTQEDLDHISNVLRKGTVTWRGRSECLRRARKKVNDGNKTAKGKPVWKYFWKCAECEQWFRDESMMEVDHIVEIGPRPRSIEEVKDYILKMYCGQENLQALCQVCHMKKTKYYVAELKFKRKGARGED